MDNGIHDKARMGISMIIGKKKIELDNKQIKFLKEILVSEIESYEDAIDMHHDSGHVKYEREAIKWSNVLESILQELEK